MILFTECLKNKIVPVVIEDANRNIYLGSLEEYRKEKVLSKLIVLFEEEQKFYYDQSKWTLPWDMRKITSVMGIPQKNLKS